MILRTKSQQEHTNNPQNKGFSSKHCIDSQKQEQIESLTDSQLQALHFLLSSKNKLRIRNTYEQIADKIKCHPKTIERAFKRYHAFGIFYSWKPGFGPMIHKLESDWLQPVVLAALRVKFIALGVMLSIALLHSNIAARANVRSFVLKDTPIVPIDDHRSDVSLESFSKNKSSSGNTPNILMTTDAMSYHQSILNPAHIAKSSEFRTMNELSHLGYPDGYVPNKKLTDDEWDKINTKKYEQEVKQNNGSRMHNFNDDELTFISDNYSKQACTHATKRMTHMLNTGVKINSPFKYFVAACESYEKDNKNKYHKQGYEKSRASIATKPTVAWKPAERAVIETDYEFALNVEKILHTKMLSDDTVNKKIAKYPNPRINILTEQEQNEIMTLVHKDCNCRKDAMRSTTVPFKSVVEAQPERNWNDLLPVKTENEPASDNLAPIMSNQPADPTFENIATFDLGEYEDDFSDCY